MSATIEQIHDFKGRYPRQLWALFFSEMWERFCFYGMRGMLTFFMVHQLFMDEKQANLQYGATQAWVYAFTFIGGLFADKILGFRKSLFWGGLLMIIGSVILAFDPKEFFFLGIAFNVVGTGFFKPNISSMVGQLYRKGDSRRDDGFSLFYAGINIGALLGGYVCIAIGKHELFSSIIPEALSWNVAFALAAVVMTISLLTFSNTRKSLGPIGLSPIHGTQEKGFHWKDIVVYGAGLVSIPIIMKMVANTTYTDWFMYVIGPFSLAYLAYELTKCDKEEVRKLIAAMFFIVFSVVFWAIYEQAGGSLSLYAADHLSDNFFGFIHLDPNGVNNSANAAFVILFAALAGTVWVWLSKRGMEPNTVVKFGLGFLFLGLGFLLFFSGRFFSNGNGVSSLDVFTLAYLVITFGELCLSPIGLSIMTKLAPARLQGYMMGMWFLASAYGQYVAGLFGASISPDPSASANEKLLVYTQGYYEFAWYAIIAGIVLIVISPIVRKLMGDVK
ncbi:MAG: peptide MFS transporter [Bacteroidota bacterium]